LVTGGIAMNRWLMGGLVGIFVGAGAYLMVSNKEMPPTTETVFPPPVVTATKASTPPVPLVLAQVVELSDLDPLLDPPAKLPTGVPFEVEGPSTLVFTPTDSAPDRIPPAVEDLPAGNQVGADALHAGGLKKVW
jgi:hypothetical protein